MREILFRGKRVGTGEWLYGHYVRQYGADMIYLPYGVDHEQGFDYYHIDIETVGQYTGLTDRNGTRIFEGDICRFREWSQGDMCWIGEVHYEHQQFVISGYPNKECESPFLLVMSRFISDNIEVIGNIHDNHDLLCTPRNDEDRERKEQ
jgi:uncharacterized phage protein (TIGR01671 family)